MPGVELIEELQLVFRMELLYLLPRHRRGKWRGRGLVWWLQEQLAGPGARRIYPEEAM